MSQHAAAADWVPSSCTLPAADVPLRVAEFGDLFQIALLRIDRLSTTEMVLRLAPAQGRAQLVRDLVDRESRCCSFFTFTLSGDDPLLLRISVPPSQAEVLDALATWAAN